MQRQLGRLRNRGPGDNAKVSVLLNDYEDADKVLVQVCPFSYFVSGCRCPDRVVQQFGANNRTCG
jgi:hypothetical protein